MTIKANEVRYPQSFMERFRAYPETMEEATWVCATCGRVPGREVTIGGETRYGPRACACQIDADARLRTEERHREWAKKQASITYGWLGQQWEDTALLAKTFENFDRSRQPEAFEMVRDYVLHLRGTIVLHGSYGTGKTHLLAALCNELRHAGQGSLFCTSPKFFASIQASVSRNEDYYSRIIDRACRCRLLVLDDIDKAKISPFREEVYTYLIDERVNNHLPIAISTNRLSELASFVGGAVCSRLQIGQIAVPMNGDDYRCGMEAV